MRDSSSSGLTDRLPGRVDSPPISKCYIPDDCIDKKRYPLFMARAVLKGLIASLQRPSRSIEL